MRLRNIPGANQVVEESKYVIHDITGTKGKYAEQFANKKQPIHLEIGMGKGQFIIGMSKKYPEINYIGIERYTSVLLRAIQKIDKLEQENKPDNLKFMCADAAEIKDYFETGEIGKIYLNFSDPWPKDRHAKRRLCSKEFLALYSEILLPGSRIEFKTDNRPLFEFGLEELKESKFELLSHTFDLHNDEEMNKDNIMTEYEEKFSAIGNPICKYIIERKNV